MARIVKDFEFSGPGRPVKYPWEEWEDGEKRILTQGEDFDADVRAMASSLYVRSRKIGRKVTVAILSDTELAFQFLPE